MATIPIAINRIKREFKEVIKSDEVFIFYVYLMTENQMKARHELANVKSHLLEALDMLLIV